MDKFIGCMSGLLKNTVMDDGFLGDSFFHGYQIQPIPLPETAMVRP